MLDSTRLRNPQLFDKIVTPEEAAALITDGMNVGVSGFTPGAALLLVRKLKRNWRQLAL